MRYLEAEEVIAINKKLVERSGEKQAVWKENELHSAIYRHKQYENIADIAAALMHSLMGNHCFEAANKRTALLAAQVILEGEGYHFSMDQTKLADRVEQMVRDKWSQEKISKWLKRRIAPHLSIQ